MTTTIANAQSDMRDGYLSGAAGILVSGLVWAAATAAVFLTSAEQAIWVLFVGGALIHPVSLLLCKMLGARGGHAGDNPLGALAMATTFWLMLSLPLAYIAHLVRIEFFFPAMLMIIGGRYLTFAALFGMRLYWVLGFALAGAGIALGYLGAAPQVSAAFGSLIEVGFALAAFVLHNKWTMGRTVQELG